MRSGLLLVLSAAVAGSVMVFSCGDDSEENLFPDSGIGMGSSASTGDGGSAGRGPAGSGGQAADAPDAGMLPTQGAPCTTSQDCVDEDLCNGTESCVMGFCRAGTPLSCQDGDPCTEDICTPATGVCSFARLPDGSACRDNDLCDGQTCRQGACTAGPIILCTDDGNPCTVEACDVKTGGCKSTPAATGTPCDDGNRCNGIETCTTGVCVANAPLDCDDENPCTADSCDTANGCLNSTLPDGTSCSDGNLCNGVELCTLGSCIPGPASTCEDNNPCTTDVCNPNTGACSFPKLVDGTPCPDGNLCDGQLCSNGQCLDGPDVACPSDGDNNVCTANTCNPATGQCLRGNVANGTPCADADVCDGGETCQSGRCSTSGTPLTCAADNNPCTVAACDPVWGCVQNNLPNGTSCADADLCDGTETCSNGACSASGTPVTCEDNNPCTTNSCNPVNGGCVFTPVADATSCSDGNVCNGAETCLAGQCSPAASPLVCDDLNACTTNACIPGTGCVFTPSANGTSCSDGNACNGLETCSAGACGPGTPVICDDSNPCTSNTCDALTGACSFPPAPDGTQCPDADQCDGIETCTGGSCSASGTPTICDDNNPCTTNSCIPATGCLFAQAPDGVSCADPDPCNGTETCSSGFCTAGTAVSCVPPQTCSSVTGLCGP